MTLRARVGLIAAVAVAVSVLVVSAGAYVATARTLVGGVDRALTQELLDLRRGPGPGRPGARGGRFGGPGVFVQIVDANGVVRAEPGEERMPVTERARAAAGGAERGFFETVETGGEWLRILTVRRGPTVAVQLGRPMTEVHEALGRLRRQLALGGLAGVALAGLLGAVVARRAVRPVNELTELAEKVASTQDLSRRIAASGDDELGRLARTFNAMLANLEQARDAQEQLVADASHELRTPLTSLRTNVEVLAQAERLDVVARRELIGDVIAQLDEFARLVGGLVELARGARPASAVTDVALDELVERVAAAARIGAQAGRLRVDLQPATVRGEEDRIERAVANLIDNALKYGAGREVEVTLRGGTLVVRDHGPGIAPEHLGHVFDRFYRAPEARSAPGSGLGLSIVRQVAEAHGGTVRAENAEGGGARLTLTLPLTRPSM